MGAAGEDTLNECTGAIYGRGTRPCGWNPALQTTQRGLEYTTLVPINIDFKFSENPIPLGIVIAFPAHSALAALISREFASVQANGFRILNFGIFGHSWY